MSLLLLALAACRPSDPTFEIPEGPLHGDVSITLNGNADALSIEVDGVAIANGDGPSLATMWDSTTVEDGPHVLTGVAESDGDPRTVDLDIVVDQTIGLGVGFVTPLEGATVSAGDVPVTVDVTHPEELASIEITADGIALTAPPVAGPWTTTWTGATAGAHVLAATVTDAEGGSSSAEIAVTVGSGLMTCRFSAPTSGDEVSVITALRADATTDARVESAKFRVNDELLLTDTVTPWLHWWDATASIGSAVVIEVEFTDAAGATCTDTIDVTVEADPAFAVAITQPSDGGRVTGEAAPIKALMAGGAGAERGELYVDGVSVATDDEADWAFSFDSTTVANGPHEMRVVGYELGTGATAEQTLAVTVENN